MCLALLAALCRPLPARAAGLGDPAEPAAAEKEGKVLHAFHIAGAAPRVDGRLDDEVWRLADSMGGFVQMEPDNMAPATEATTVQIAYDERYIYVGIHCFFRNPADIAAGLGRRDNAPRSDRIYVNFDPRHDHLTAYTFTINPSGVLGDWTWFDDTRQNSDYDAVWDGSAEIVADGWTAEMRIPFSQMRFSAGSGEMVWGLNVTRENAKTSEQSRWVSTRRGDQGFVSRFGHLVFDDRIAPPRRLELIPFTVASASRDSSASPVENKALGNAGLDVRFGLGTSTTVSATINPDFGQVEADPAVLNLSVYPTFYPEKRPFFLEDSRTFVLPYGQVPDFYSRRIGAEPGFIDLADNEELVSKPDQTTILGAAKITGKASGWTWGGLSAVTAREYATVDVTNTDSDGNDVVTRVNNRLIEPATVYSVGRVQRDILHSTSNVGMILTSVARGDKQLDAITGGPDYNLRWSKNRFSLGGHVIATHAPVDGEIKNAWGMVQNFGFNNKSWSVFAHADHFDKDFHNSDLGFLGSRTDKTEASGGVSWLHPDPGPHLRRWELAVSYNRQWNRDNLVFVNNPEGELFARFSNYWWIDSGGGYNARHLDDLDTRGGPPILRRPNGYVYMNVNTDTRKMWSGFIHIDHGFYQDGGSNARINPRIQLQPSSQLQLSLGVSYLSGRDTAQWIENDDLDGDGTDENVYGRLRRHVVDITARGTYAFSPTMTLEAYLQPFVAVGDYTDIRKLARPSSFDFDPVTIEDDPDFNRKSLRGTMVWRWEYQRGSTLFLVWNMSNLDETRPGEFSAWRDLGSGFRAPGKNAFVAKLTYWFTP